MGYRPGSCVVVEESPSGVTAARAAGMAVIAYAGLTPARFLHGADAVIDDIRQLVTTINHLTRSH